MPDRHAAVLFWRRMKLFVQLVNFTLSFCMWLIVGRVLVTLITGGRDNFMVSFFVRFTEPFYRLTAGIVPFARVSPEREGTTFARIGGCIPFYAIALIIVARILFFIVMKQLGLG